MAGPERLRPTRALARHRRCQWVLRKVEYVQRHFPELEDLNLEVGLTRRAAGLADLEAQAIWLNPNHLSLHTIAHELTHLLQARRLVPHGERACDVFALARHPSLADALPSYLDIPRRLADNQGWLIGNAGAMLHAVATAALAERQTGRRRYIRWFEEEVQRRAPVSRPEPPVEPPEPFL